jgi:hypothetical protein
LDFSPTHLTISLGADCPESARDVSEITSQTVFELEVLAEGLRYVAEGKLPDFHEVPSRAMLFGPRVGIRPSAGVCLSRTLFFSSLTLRQPRTRRRLVWLEAMHMNWAVRATFEVDDVPGLAEELYQQAKAMAEFFVHWDLDPE